MNEWFPRLVSVMDNSNCPACEPVVRYCTDAEIVSPGEIVMLVTFTEFCGYISYQT